MIIIKLDFGGYAIGYILDGEVKKVEYFDTYEQARQELHYLNGGVEYILGNIGNLLDRKL